MLPKSKRIILPDFPYKREKDPPLYPNVAALKFHLENRGIECRGLIYSCRDEFSSDSPAIRDVLEIVSSRGWENAAIGFGVYIFNEKIVLAVISELRRRGVRNPIILGGPMITNTGRGLLEARYPGATFSIRGYAEEALLGLLQAGSEPRIRGLHRFGMPDACTYAHPDFAILPMPMCDATTKWLESKRGCPYRCAYCQYFPPGRDRVRSVEKNWDIIEAAIRQIVASGCNDLKFIDPTFNCGKTYKRILRLFIDLRYAGKLAAECRLELVDSEFLDLISHLDFLPEFGLQTTDPRILRHLDRKNDMNKLKCVTAELNRRNQKCEVQAMFGLPGQTLASFRKDREAYRQLGIRTLRWCPFGLYPGSKLEREKEKWGFVTTDDLEGMENLPIVTASNSFSRTDWEMMRDETASDD